MDPNASVTIFNDHDRDLDEREDALSALCLWRSKGGFAPRDLLRPTKVDAENVWLVKTVDRLNDWILESNARKAAE